MCFDGERERGESVDERKVVSVWNGLLEGVVDGGGEVGLRRETDDRRKRKRERKKDEREREK